MCIGVPDLSQAMNAPKKIKTLRMKAKCRRLAKSSGIGRRVSRQLATVPCVFMASRLACSVRVVAQLLIGPLTSQRRRCACGFRPWKRAGVLHRADIAGAVAASLAGSAGERKTDKMLRVMMLAVPVHRPVPVHRCPSTGTRLRMSGGTEWVCTPSAWMSACVHG